MILSILGKFTIMTEFYLILIAAIILMGMVFILLAINILLKKNGRFPVISIGGNKNMQKRGIYCVKHEEMLCKNNVRKGGGCCN